MVIILIVCANEKRVLRGSSCIQNFKCFYQYCTNSWPFSTSKGMKRMTFNPIKPEEKERLSIREHLALVKGICKKFEKKALSQLTNDIQKYSFARFKLIIPFPPLSNL